VSKGGVADWHVKNLVSRRGRKGEH
jgi:hypothetical protein